jgi:hypothetical protein
VLEEQIVKLQNLVYNLVMERSFKESGNWVSLLWYSYSTFEYFLEWQSCYFNLLQGYIYDGIKKGLLSLWLACRDVAKHWSWGRGGGMAGDFTWNLNLDVKNLPEV